MKSVIAGAVLGMLTLVVGCEKTHTGDTYVFSSDDGSVQTIQMGNDDGNVAQSAAGHVNPAESEEEEGGTNMVLAAVSAPTGLVTLHRVFQDGAWSDIWIDRDRNQQYAAVVNSDGQTEYVLIGPA